MPRQLFGTDGIRGVAGEFPLDPRTVHALGAALGKWLTGTERGAKVVIGMDTRESSPALVAQVAGGLARYGIGTRFAGLITTPGVAWLARSGPYAAGVMISASHNPYQDNGIKVFGHSGYKLPDKQEHAIEREIFAQLEAGVAGEPLALAPDTGLDAAYLDWLVSTFEGSLSGLHMVIDCANGAASCLAQQLFGRLGARVETICVSPDGRNINLNCGALHVGALREAVLAVGAELGVAFDGDADRAIFVARSGKIVDGDAVLLIAARHLLRRGRLLGPNRTPAVVATQMSNFGLEEALAAHGVRLVRTPVGDKYVLEEMLRIGAVLGGEQSGHVIFHEYATTGDGLLTALRVLEIVLESSGRLDELAAELKTYPQRLINVPVRVKRPLAELPAVVAEIRAAERAFAGSGRVFVRFSGTEPLARVMVEGADADQVESHAARIAAAIQRELGAG